MVLTENHTVSLRNEDGADVTRMSEQLSTQHLPSICPSHGFSACFSQEAS